MRTLRLWVHLETGDIASIMVDPDNPHIWVSFDRSTDPVSILIKNNEDEVVNKSTYTVPVPPPDKPRWWPF